MKLLTRKLFVQVSESAMAVKDLSHLMFVSSKLWTADTTTL